jgi:NTE family protein
LRNFRTLVTLIECLFFFQVSTLGLAAAEERDHVEREERPRIGVVLSGGGARGAAHVGVLLELERLQVPIDFIAGTSMGAVVGGLYASGIEPQELKTILETLDWDALFTDKTRRRDLAFRRKQDDRRFQSTFQLSFKNGKFQLPTGLIGGQRLNQTLEILALPVATVRNFDELPTPFRAVATDIATGQPRALGQGDLATAIRASMSIPGVFVPVNVDGTLLVDGGSTMNLPVQAARDMGADVIIAVDISTPLRQADQLDSAIAITAQTITMQIQENTNTQIDRLTDRDILLRPALPDIQTMSFNKVLEASRAGVEATQMKSDELKRFSLSDEEWKRHRASRKKPSRALPIIRSLAVENNSSVSDSVLLSKINVPINEPLNVTQLRYDIDVLYGLDIFEIVEFEIQSLESGGKELIIRVDDRLTGPNRIRFGVNLETDFETGSLFNIGISATRLPFNRLDAEWRNEFAVGEDPAVTTEFWQPLDPNATFFIAPKVGFGAGTLRFYNENGDEISNFRTWALAAGLSLGSQLGTWGEVRAGIRYQKSRARLQVGDPSVLPIRDVSDGDFFLRFAVDTLDSAKFPTKGTLLLSEASFQFKSLGAVEDFQTLSVMATQTLTVHKTTFLFETQISTVFENVREVGTLMPLGGFLRLSGLSPNELRGPHMGLFRIRAYHKISELGLLSFRLPTYIGGSIESGNVWNSSSEISGSSLLWGGSVYLALDTPLSPLYFAYGYTEGGRNAVYLFIGQVF